MTTTGVELDNRTVLEIFKRASLIRRVDERVRGLIDEGRLKVNYYSPRGQEIVAACMGAALSDEDYVVTIYRGIHDQLAKGMPLRLLMAEYFGKVAGACGGRGGPMHLSYPPCGVMVTTGIVGSGMPIANGLALASQVRGDGRVTVANFGDGACNIGAFGESLNLASVWRLPVVFLCQNNMYAEHTSHRVATAGKIADRAIGYGMPGVSVDGNDVRQMFGAAVAAVERARSGGGPTLIEARTFRFLGHNYGDPGDYIPRAEYDAALAQDPFPRLLTLMDELAVVSNGEREMIIRSIDDAIDDAIAFAEEAAWPETRSVMAHVRVGVA